PRFLFTASHDQAAQVRVTQAQLGDSLHQQLESVFRAVEQSRREKGRVVPDPCLKRIRSHKLLGSGGEKGRNHCKTLPGYAERGDGLLYFTVHADYPAVE